MAENLSGVPPEVTLSGLGMPPDGAFSGSPNTGLGGAGFGGGAPFGMEGGLDLASLMQLLQGQQGPEAGVGTGSNILQSLTQGSLGQQTGGLGAGSFGQTQPGYTAGQTVGSGAAAAAGEAAGSTDPLAIIQKILGLAQKGAGLIGSGEGVGTASPTVGDTGGASLSDQLRSQAGTASPVNPYGVIEPLTGLPASGSQAQPVFGPDGVPTSGFGETGGVNQTYLNQASPGQFGTLLDPATVDSLFQAGLTGDQIKEFLSGGGGFESGAGDFTSGTGGSQLDTSLGGTGSAGPGFGLGNVQAGLGGAGSLLGLIQGGLNGTLSPGSVLQAIQGIYQGATGALGVSPIASLIAELAPELASSLGTLGGASGAAASGAAGASAGLSTVGGAVAPIIAAIVSYLANSEEMRARGSGAVNNPIAGGLNSAATRGIGQDLAVLQQLQGAGGYDAQTPEQLQSLLAGLTNNLIPYYSDAQGGRGPILASDTVTGRSFGNGQRTPTGSADEYTRNAVQAQQGIGDIIQNLLGRGLTYEQIGQTPGVNENAFQGAGMAGSSPDWWYAMNPWKYDPEGQKIAQSAYGQMTQAPQEAEMVQSGEGMAPTGRMIGGPQSAVPQGLSLTPQDILTAAQASALTNPGGNQGNLISAMFGGPLWGALARTGGGNDTLRNLISQHFDPWAVVRGFSPEQLNTALDPYVYAPWLQQQAQREAAFTGSGGVSGDAGAY